MGNVKITRCSKEYKKWWRPKQGKSRWKKQKKRKKKKVESER